MLLHVLLASTAATAPPSQLSSYRVRERGALRPLSPALTKLRGGSGGGLDWRYFVAGSISAGLSHGYTTPIDVVKTRMQTNPELYNGSVALAVRRIVDDEGALFLLQGLGPTLVGYGLEGAIKFGSYEMAKPLFAHVTPSKMVNYLLASCVAGALASTVQRPRGRTTARARPHATRRRTHARATRPSALLPPPLPPPTTTTTAATTNRRRLARVVVVAGALPCRGGAHQARGRPRVRARRARCAAADVAREGRARVALGLPGDVRQAGALHDGHARRVPKKATPVVCGHRGPTHAGSADRVGRRGAALRTRDGRPRRR